jgi:hypothetical protein
MEWNGMGGPGVSNKAKPGRKQMPATRPARLQKQPAVSKLTRLNITWPVPIPAPVPPKRPVYSTDPDAWDPDLTQDETVETQEFDPAELELFLHPDRHDSWD